MSGSDGPAADPTPSLPPDAGPDRSADSLTLYPGAGADDRSYLAFLRAAEAPPAQGRFPLLAFAFMLSMALIVAGLGFGLLGREVGMLASRDTNGADDGSAGGTTAGHGDAVPLCDDLTRRQEAKIDDALTLMGKTREGRRLADQLASHDDCIGVDDLAYNSGYASADRSWTGSWDDSYIMIDVDLLATAEPDVLAALLVHEATHIDRYVRGQACGPFDDCEVLDNGVVVEEEVAAHAAEAQWWIGVYGPGGRRVYSGYGYSIDVLAAAYLEGEEAFRAFVIELRSDPRDGRGL